LYPNHPYEQGCDYRSDQNQVHDSTLSDLTSTSEEASETLDNEVPAMLSNTVVVVASSSLVVVVTFNAVVGSANKDAASATNGVDPVIDSAAVLG
jgi:hypothetical protein